MTTSTMELLPGTEVHARGLRWQVVSSQSLGAQTLCRLRGLENAVLGHELDVLHPFEVIEPIRHDLRPDRAALADFAMPERRLAIYIDGAAFHVGQRLRRDRFIRDRLRHSNPPWQVEELRAGDLGQGASLVERVTKVST